MAKVNEFWVSGFTADTPVAMANGTVKSISKVQEGDWVASFNPKTGEKASCQVTGIWSNVMTDVLEVNIDNDETMLVAASQLFYTSNGEFKSAPDADNVVDADGTAHAISAKKFRGGKVKLYDITVQDNHTFIANGYRVHNKGESSPPPPPPPPSPVVTAGKVGQPLSINVNGNTVTVNPPPGSVATVSVSYNGGINTGVNAVPGVATINVPLPINTNPRVDYGTVAFNYMISAAAEQVNVCDAMAASPAVISLQNKSSWQASLNRLKVDVSNAQRNDQLWWSTPGVSFTSNVGATPTTIYLDTLNEINDLKVFISRERTLSQGDRDFIAAKCNDISTRISELQDRLKPGQGIAVPQPSVSTSSFDRIYSSNPNYGYALNVGNVNGCNVYFVRPPNSTSNGPTYYKHFDPSVGQFYLSQDSDNCI